MGEEELVEGKERSIEVLVIEVGVLDAIVVDTWLGKESVPVGFVGAACEDTEFCVVEEDGDPEAVGDWPCCLPDG